MIIITTYYGRADDSRFVTRRKYLEDTILSIDKQCMNNLFHLIVDDGSTDGTYEYLQTRYSKSFNRRIVRREKQSGEPLTSTNARNLGINLCLNSSEIDGIDITEQKYITFIDSDDFVFDLVKRERYISTNNIGFLYTDAILFFTNYDTAFFWKGLDPSRAYWRFWIYGRMPYPTMTWSIKFLRDLTLWVENNYGISGPFDPNIGCGEDVDIALSSFECASNKNYKIGYLPKITAGYRLHELSLASIRNETVRAREENIVLARHFGKSRRILLHVGRFFVRTECYIPKLIYFKNIFRTKTSKGKYLD